MESSGAAPPAGVEHSAPVFERARRLAAALFGLGEEYADIVLICDGSTWRSRDGQGRMPADAPVAGQVIAAGEPLWVEDIGEDFPPERLAAYGLPRVRSYVVTPIRLEDGTIPGVLVVFGPSPRAHDGELVRRLQDVADFVADEWTRVRAQRARELSARERDLAHHTLAAVVRSAPLLLALTDRELRLVDASPPWFEARGLRREEVLGRSIFAVDPSSASWRDVFHRALEGEPFEADKIRVQGPVGDFRWGQARVAPWRAVGGEIGGVIMVVHNVTQIVEAMEAATRSEERLKLAVEMARLHVWELDLRSGAFSQAAGSPIVAEGATADPQNPWRNVDPQDAPAVRAAWRRTREQGEPFHAEYRVNHSDGRQLWVAARARTIRDRDGRPLRLVGAVQDVTARRAQEAALVQAKEEAEAANRAKSAFLATVSHEIRTPLNGLMGMVQAIAMGELDPVQRERLEVIRSSSDGLLTILNELLDLSKIEAGKLSLEDGEFEVGELVRGACATFRAVAENKGLALSCRITPAARARYRGDPMRVRQILHNLLSNALKFTEAGGVAIAVSRRAGRLTLEVADTGIGMSAAELKKLFRAFEQAQASTSRRYGGTGLGLAICRELVELMGGRIEVKSAPGEGTRFVVVLPLQKIEARRPAPPPVAPEPGAAEPDRPLRVLAAEDNSVNQLVLKTLLNQIGVEPMMVPDGRAAVEAWAGQPWDLVLMDVEMPGLDGPAATAEIRARERAEGRPRTPIIALTANAMEDQVARYLAAGMDGHVAKPIAASRLFAAMQAALGAAPASDAEAAA